MQAALCRRQSHGAVFASGSQRVGRCRIGSIVRAGDGEQGSKVVREFREDSGEMVVPGAQKKADSALYADQVPQALKPKENISKEMKQRLRQEYYGLGGAENKVSRPSRAAAYIIAASSLLTQELETAAAPARNISTTYSSAEIAEAAAAAKRALNSASASPAAAGSAKKGGSKWVIYASENLKSTREHRLWTYGCMGILCASMAGAAADIHSPGDAATVLGAVFAAYVLSDLGTAVYHWGVDNYGDGSTPVFGRQIAAFQGHHQRPWTITQREFCNNLHQVFKPAAAPAAAIFALGPFVPLAAHAFMPSFLLLVCMSQQFHAWSHMKKSELPGLVVALQDANVLIGRKQHGAHHKPNFDGNYSIVSGWWNPLLDGSGFFRWLEQRVADTTGVEPRCWYAPDHEWAEQVQPGQQA